MYVKYDYIIIEGGHEFKDENMNVEEFKTLKVIIIKVYNLMILLKIELKTLIENTIWQK